MNIKERNDILLQRMDMVSFSNNMSQNPLVKARNFNWNALYRPPIVNYVPQNIINDITQLTHDPKMMNNPSKKYKLMNQILASIRFRPLASGTNRRAFYCEYDPGIILKVGSDRVGRSDNISEYYMQQNLRPFCCKIYDVLPNGIMSLMERGETMKLPDFRSKWSKEIYDLIMLFLYRGYVLEDIGGNFYKNWAIRLDFGPILVDFPYLYELDWSKLQCIHVDPLTGNRCDGELDYDYDKGMSEIVCEKCGSRYSANYLARLINTESQAQMIKGRTFQMFNLPEGMKMVLCRGNKIVYSTYNEVDKNEVPIVMADKSYTKPQNPKVNSQYQKYQSPKQDISSESNQGGYIRKFQFIKEDRLKDIMEFLDMYRVKYGTGAAIDIARRLELIYYTPEERQQYGYNLLPQKGQTLKESHKKQQQQEPPPQSIGPSTSVELALPNKIGSINTSPTQPYYIPTQEQLAKAESVPKQNMKPTEGLIPVRPKTAEELEQEDLLNRTDNAIMGFPGEPLVQTMKTKTLIPVLKQKVVDKLNNFEEKDTEEQTFQFLKEEVLKLVAKDIADLLGCKTDMINAFVNGSYDHLNNSCYTIKIEGPNGDPSFDVTLYSKNNNQSNNQASSRKIADGINPLDNSKPNSVLSDDLRKYLDHKQTIHLKELLNSRESIMDFSSTITNLFIEDLQKEKNMQFAEANSIAYNYMKELKKSDIVDADDIVSQL